MVQTDRLGRSTFDHIAPQVGVKPTKREVRWFKHIERHGPQSSQYLYELTRDTHSCRDTALRQLRKLRAGGYLTLPRQQRFAEHADFNPYIYDLTPKAKDHLFDLGLAEPTVCPTGHWWHGYMTSCVTSSIDIAAAREGVGYIPAHQILAKKKAQLALPVAGAKLIPDQLFALNYGGSFRAFALEVDRGTEPKTSPTQRKNWSRSIEQYLQVIELNIYKAHYGLTANMLTMWVFTSRAKEQRFLELLSKYHGAAIASFLTTAIPAQRERSMNNSVWAGLFSKPWNRANGTPVMISKG
ncbi:replication-relaxation family protein [Aliiroseovarius lamellibrachiae]|uniref:replication-relaxation family protein n=1 Tax=Aliiroseovarius lamellibrachiae TaxID=1924933 RepID=UPI001BDFAB7E|nr:replication-relaxation family protein [Aliiroseovarius lamellibrachiae]MBT2132357.1 replication-relaxation family protein [Aliiroseovarius lamellibrachiae]